MIHKVASGNTLQQPRSNLFNTLSTIITTPWLAMLVTVLLAPLRTLDRNLWTDEAFTFSYTFHASLSQVYADAMRNEGTPPLYFTLIWYWSKLFGTSEVALRSFSILSAVLAIWVFHRLASRLFNKVEAGFLTLLMACAPIVGYYIVEARTYTLALLVASLHLATFQQLLTTPQSIKALILSACTAILILYTIFFGAVLVVAQGLFFGVLLLYRRSWSILWRWVLAQILVIVAIVPLLPWLSYQIYIDPAVDASWITGSAYYWFVLSLVMNIPAVDLWFFPWMLAAVFITSLILVGVIVAQKAERALVVWSFLLPSLLIGVVITIFGDAAPRYLIVLLPGGLLTLNVGLRRLREQRHQLAQVLSISLLLVLITLRIPGIIYPEKIQTRVGVSRYQPWTKLIPILKNGLQPGTDVIVFHPPWDMRIFEYYERNIDAPLLGAHDYDTFYFYQGHPLRTSWNAQQLELETQPYNRIWIFHDNIYHQVPQIKLPYKKIGFWEADGMTLTLYER